MKRALYYSYLCYAFQIPRLPIAKGSRPKQITFLADKSFAPPPPLTDMSAENERLFWTAPLNNAKKLKHFFCESCIQCEQAKKFQKQKSTISISGNYIML